MLQSVPTSFGISVVLHTWDYNTKAAVWMKPLHFVLLYFFQELWSVRQMGNLMERVGSSFIRALPQWQSEIVCLSRCALYGANNSSFRTSLRKIQSETEKALCCEFSRRLFFPLSHLFALCMCALESSLVTDVQIKKVLDVFFVRLFHRFVTWTCAEKQREFKISQTVKNWWEILGVPALISCLTRETHYLRDVCASSESDWASPNIL